MRSANVIALERGVNDAGLTGGRGPFGLSTFLNYVSFIHRLKRPVIFIEDAPNADARNYGLAGYFLVNNGRDFLSSDPFGEPDKFWPGYRTGLGQGQGRPLPLEGPDPAQLRARHRAPERAAGALAHGRPGRHLPPGRHLHPAVLDHARRLLRRRAGPLTRSQGVRRGCRCTADTSNDEGLLTECE